MNYLLSLHDCDTWILIHGTITMKYYQETRLFDSYGIKLQELYECKRQVSRTCRKLCHWGHITDSKFADIMDQLETTNVCQLQDIILKLLRGAIDRCQNQVARNDIWKHLKGSIYLHKEICQELLKGFE
jgi:hypothetical protein